MAAGPTTEEEMLEAIIRKVDEGLKAVNERLDTVTKKLTEIKNEVVHVRFLRHLLDSLPEPV